MILYRLADGRDRPASTAIASSSPHGSDNDSLLPPPKFPASQRDSLISYSGDSLMSLSSDSKYPSGLPGAKGELVAYYYDPALDESQAPDEEDFLHDPSKQEAKGTFPWRGIFNVSVLLFLIACILTLFVFYPVLTYFRSRNTNDLITQNTRINGTGTSSNPVWQLSLIFWS
jgi:hypothetical protein